MTCSAIVNTIGLAIDILGAVLLFLFSLKLNYKMPDGSQAFQTPYSEDIIKHIWGSRFGLGLLVLGFLIQAISNFL